MAQKTINKPTADPVVFPLNHKTWTEPFATIQNNTSDALTVDVTNMNIQTTPAGSVVWSAVPSGPLSIPAGDIGELVGPFEAARFSGAGTGDIDIVEAQ